MLHIKSKGVTIMSAPSNPSGPPPSESNPGESEPLDRPRPRLDGKSIWDWLDLLSKLAIPLVVVLATVGFGLWQARLADLQHQSDQQSALDQQRAAILQTYINNMQDLLLNHNLRKSKPGDEIRQLAREQTLTTLRRLDADRNRTVFRFLQDARLVGAQDAVINLSGADLSHATLNGADLSGTDLSGTNLSGTDLISATLTGAHLNGSTLIGTSLYGADLNGATLTGAHLNGATLTGAFLGDAILNGSTLTGTQLNGAILTGTHLNGSTLSAADLNGADLSAADLSGADLSDADLSDAPGLTQPQLDKVHSCRNAILSTGLTCHHNVREKNITLTYWYTESAREAPVIVELIKKFQQQNPNIKIHRVNKPFFQTQSEFRTAALARKAPDVLRSDVGWVTQFASQRYLLNIDSYISQSDLSDYLPAALEYDKYNGYLYGLPQVTDFLALLYNKTELASAGITSPPATMADFEADAVKVVQSKAALYGFETTGTSYYVLPFLYAFGGGMLDQHYNILVNNAGSVAGLNFLLKLQNTGKAMPAKVSNMVNDFMSGKTAMIFTGPWDVSEIRTGSVFTGHPSNLGISGIPRGPAKQTGSPLGGQSYVISAGTAHPAEAYKFISFMSSTASQVAIAEANHTLPTRQSAYQDGVSSDPVIKAFLSIKNTARARPAIPQVGYLFDAFDPHIGAVLDGVQSPIEALNAVADTWKQFLAGS